MSGHFVFLAMHLHDIPHCFHVFLDQGGLGSDRMSDDSSKEAVSDSHPDTLTDPEFSDPPNVTSSPPHSGDEVRRDKDKVSKYSGNI